MTGAAGAGSTTCGRRDEPRAETPGSELTRFDLAERVVHWTTAALMVTLIVTGAILYIPALALDIGHRGVVETVHVITGLALLAPLAAGLAGPWRRPLLRDLRRVDRWGPSDFAWFRPSHRRGAPAPGALAGDKFNGGQKLEAALLGGSMVAALATGVIMRYAPASWLRWQTGATLVHDVLFVTIVLAVGAHVAVALSRPDQLVSMMHGKISRSWANAHAAAWLDEVEANGSRADDAVDRQHATQAPSSDSSSRGPQAGV